MISVPNQRFLRCRERAFQNRIEASTNRRHEGIRPYLMVQIQNRLQTTAPSPTHSWCVRIDRNTCLVPEAQTSPSKMTSRFHSFQNNMADGGFFRKGFAKSYRR